MGENYSCTEATLKHKSQPTQRAATVFKSKIKTAIKREKQRDFKP
jgi:hypothetical protein